MLTAEDIIQNLQQKDEEDLYDGFVAEDSDCYKEDLGESEIVDCKMRYEEEYTATRYFKDHGVHISLDYNTDSYGNKSAYKNSLKQVRPIKTFNTEYVSMDSPRRDDVPPTITQSPITEALLNLMKTMPEDVPYNIDGAFYKKNRLMQEIKDRTELGKTFEEGVLKRALSSIQRKS